MKNPSNFLTIFVLLATVQSLVNGLSLENNTNTKVWNDIDRLCQSVITEMHVSNINSSYLRIIEYTQYSYRTHRIYPSGAKGLLSSSFFEKDSPTVIIIHGFNESPMIPPAKSIADAYKKHGSYNVLALDASVLIKMLYARSVKMAKYIGDTLSIFLYELTLNGVDPNKLHLIGFSLGAHIAGFAGKSYQYWSNGQKLPRITGLDPALPCFGNVRPENRLDSADAYFVDIIHTNSGILGLDESIGHANFFPNRGLPLQPGCSDNLCSHGRAWQFYQESVNEPDNFVGVMCENWANFMQHKCTGKERAVMGFHTPNSTRGDFYLKTASYADYGLKTQGIN